MVDTILDICRRPEYLDTLRIFLALGLMILGAALVLDYGYSIIERNREDDNDGR